MLLNQVRESVAQTLKQQTSQHHQALEDLLLPRLQSIHSCGDYTTLLKAFYGFFKPVEQLIEHYITTSVLPDIKERRKADLILQDLASLGANGAALASYGQLPAITSVQQAMGALYVLEGSTLGGRGITKMLLKKEAAGLHLGHLQFFNGYGEETGKMWTSFLHVLNAQEGDLEEIVAAANNTFLYFKNWLQKNN